MPDLELEAIDYLNQALDRFDEALAIPLSNPLAIDGTIQRFEFCFELSWKAVKVIANYFGEEKRSPRDAIKAAYGFGWIDDEELWLDILKSRNVSSHTYHEPVALVVYSKLPSYGLAMRSLAVALKQALAKGTIS